MSNKKVAGTIILNLNDGSKKFLMHPLFVFEMDEQALKNEMDKDYTWVAPAELKTIWSKYHIEGVPMF